jgi:hypothetical protein
LKNTGLKFSSLEGRLNNLVLSVFIFNLIAITISAILAGVYQVGVVVILVFSDQEFPCCFSLPLMLVAVRFFFATYLLGCLLTIARWPP